MSRPSALAPGASGERLRARPSPWWPPRPSRSHPHVDPSHPYRPHFHLQRHPAAGRAKELTGGRGADVVYDGVGGAIGRESLRCLRFGGRYLIIGWASTPDVARGRGERGAPNANQPPTNLIMMKRLDVLGCPVALSTFEDPSLGPPRRAQLLAWAEEGRLKPRVSHRFPLNEFRAALTAKWRGEVLGSCVLHPRS